MTPMSTFTAKARHLRGGRWGMLQGYTAESLAAKCSFPLVIQFQFTLYGTLSAPQTVG
jgi:protein involved in ribonucleotide reduction